MDITKIVELGLMILACVYTYILLPWLKERAYWSKLKCIIGFAVRGAEMLFTDPKSGAAKKEYVMGILAEHGYTVDDSAINAAVESAVLELKESLK